ncbi:hypothetical protein SLE2022_026120 [Rubroshorea leprosula]
MAFVIDQQQPADFIKYYCKICNKGFGCGRGLGGHMRAHGSGGGDSGHIDDDDPASDWEDHKVETNVSPSNKRMYALRTDTNRLKSCCRACENCGKEFSSWKSFLEHGKCNSEEAESLVSLQASDNDDGTARRGCGWSKRKRSLRSNVGNNSSPISPSSEEEDLANCLMMLSSAKVDPSSTEPEESCASASKEDGQRNSPVMNFISPISCKAPMAKSKGVAKGMFECKSCKKVFNSHQALGGHRASHKKVKGCFAARMGDEDEHDLITHEEVPPGKSNSAIEFETGNTSIGQTKRKSKVHECSICHRVFSSGQALGGHKRCHWITSNSPDTASFANKFHQFQDHLEQIQHRPMFIENSQPLDLKLDLNLPAPTAEIFLQPWIATVGVDEHQQQQTDQTDNVKNNNCLGKVKLAKLSELKDINVSESSSPWLQVGIGSTTEVMADP